MSETGEATQQLFEGVASLPRYAPFGDTLRLYAGWLLAWYALTFSIASYTLNRALPFHLPWLEDMATSPFVISLAFGVFLFLLLSSLHRTLHGRLGLGLLLTLPGVFLWFLFWLNA